MVQLAFGFDADQQKNRVATVPELDKFFDEVTDYRRSDSFREMMNFIARFPHVAPYNAMLLHLQLPGCALALSAYEWKKRFNRTVNLGARPLIILRLFGPISFVFDISDTEGDPVPREWLEPYRASDNVDERQMRLLIENMLREGIRCSLGDQAKTMGGLIAYGNIPEKIVEIQHGTQSIEILTLLEVVLNRKQNDPVNFTTLLHELAHFYCGHCPHPKIKWIPKREALDEREVEFEAESVSWLVCQRMGIENNSAEYLAHHLSDDDTIPNISMDAVVKAVGKIERLLKGLVPPRRELIVKRREDQEN